MTKQTKMETFNIDKLFKQLTKEGFVMIYDNDNARKFKDWLEYIQFPFTINSDGYDWYQRNRFQSLLSDEIITK